MKTNRIRSWYRGRSPWARFLIRYFGTLAVFGLAIFIVWVHYHRQGVASPDQGRVLLHQVGETQYVVFISLLVFTLVARQNLTLQMCGSLATFWAGAELKAQILSGQGYANVPEWRRDLVEAAFQVGSWAFLIYIVVFIGLAGLDYRRRRQERRRRHYGQVIQGD